MHHDLELLPMYCYCQELEVDAAGQVAIAGRHVTCRCIGVLAGLLSVAGQYVAVMHAGAQDIALHGMACTE